jgi:hypothetical protein
MNQSAPPIRSLLQQGGYCRPLTFHWFHRKGPEKIDIEQGTTKDKSIWKPFSIPDSAALETAFISSMRLSLSL